MRTPPVELFAPVGSAIDLAIFRITLAIFLAWNESVVIADASAALPEAARVAPWGVAWLLPLLVITPASVRAVRWVLWIACVTGGIGLFSRASFAVASIAASYVFLVPQLGGAVFHDHHLLWLAIVLAASPCGDALSIDAWLARRRGAPRPTHGRAHGAAIRLAWMMLGCVFFFPGVHKLGTSGLAWVTSDNLRNQMWWKWAQNPAAQPSFRIDRHPWLLHLGAAATIALELAFPFLVFRGPRTRALAVIAALCFHAATEYFMGIRFTVLWVTYGVFVPWSKWIGSESESESESARESERRGLRALGVIGGPLIAGIVAAGALGIVNGYPFACFPTFEWIVPDRMMELEITIDRGGDHDVLDRALWRDPTDPREWALEWRLVGAYDAFDPARLDAFFRDRVARRPALAAVVAGADAIDFARIDVAIEPEHRGDVLARAPLSTLTLGAR